MWWTACLWASLNQDQAIFQAVQYQGSDLMVMVAFHFKICKSTELSI